MKKAYLQYMSLLLASVVLSVTTVILGALPMLVVRRLFGRLPFWAGMTFTAGILATIVSSPYGILMFSLAVLIGVYCEIEEHGGAVFSSAFVGTLAAVGTTAFAVGLWVNRTNGRLLDEARQQLEPLVTKIASVNATSGLDVDSVLQQLPSGIVIGYVLALAIALLGERRLLGWTGKVETAAAKAPAVAPGFLSSFRVPDLFIWVTIATIFGAFYQHGNQLAEIISVNVLNVLVVVFFFQGIAIVSHAFRIFKVGPFWQSLWYMLLVLQLFLLVSLVGFADFWMDFRTKLTAKPAENKKVF